MAGFRPPKLAAWSGWAARLPAGARMVVVVAPGARVVAVGEVMAFCRFAATCHAGAGGVGIGSGDERGRVLPGDVHDVVAAALAVDGDVAHRAVVLDLLTL